MCGQFASLQCDAQFRLRAAEAVARRRHALAALLALALLLTTELNSAEIQLPPADPQAALSVSANSAVTWRDGEDEVWVLSGDCAIQQAESGVQGSDAVVWLRRAATSEPLQATVYFEGNVTLRAHEANRDKALATVRSGHWTGQFQSHTLAQFQIGRTERLSSPPPPIYERAVRARAAGGRRQDEAVMPAQFAQPDWTQQATPPSATATGRRIEVRPRGSVGLRARYFPRGAEGITIVDSGVRIRIYGYAESGVIDIATDRLVIWSQNQNVDLSSGIDVQDQPIEFYLEGNIVFRQGQQEIFAEKMYYNVQGEFGVVLKAEVLARVPELEGVVRLKADVLRQLDRNRYQASDAAVTTSRLGVPQYWVQTESLLFENYNQPILNPFTGQLEADPSTGALAGEGRQTVSAEGSAVYLGGWPVFYWPSFSSDLTRPTYYLESIAVNSDSVFGNQLLTRWNLFQTFGMPQPKGIDWLGTADYLSDRGFGFGMDLDYDRDQLFGRPAENKGFLDSWFINDHGLDNLGENRRALAPEVDFRGRALGRHRHRTPSGYQFSAELGWISDGNFLEQYYEQEWDQEKDQITGLELKRLLGSGSWGVTADARLNSFFTQTEWLRLDHFQIGHSLLGDRLTWHEHTNVGYGRLKPANLGEIPSGGFTFQQLPWEVPAEGVRAASRQEVDLPLQLGAVRVVPYLLGEAAYWQEDIDFQEVTRLMGQAGVRTSVPLWRVDPTVQNPLLNLNGLSHKVVLEAELFWADVDQPFDQFPLYDPLDDDAVEFYLRTFGDIPLRYDSRKFALRNGMQRWVSAPSTEIAGDLATLRLGARHRWQTKRGLPGQQRIVDWLTFDIEGLFYPRADQDNFGQEVGPLTYDTRWHVGDRVTLLSDGYFDLFSQGLRTFSVGGALSRPARSEYFLGFRSIEGPLSSNIVTSSTTYQLSSKWILRYASSVDFSKTGNIGQTGSITRVGESFLVSLGFNYDKSRDNLGLRFAIEPRIFTSKLGRIAGRTIPPVGFYGLD